MTTPHVAFSLTSLLGPLGGLIGMAFGAGAASGWGFAFSTVLRVTKRQVEDLKEAHAQTRREARQEKEDCDRRIATLEARVKEVEDRYTGGMERQLGQVRQSTVRVLKPGEDGGNGA